MKEFQRLIEETKKMGASDLHFVCGTPPFVRINGEIIILKYEKLTPDNIKKIISDVIPQKKMDIFYEKKELCTSLEIPNLCYIRITLYSHKGNLEASIRIGASEIKTFEELGLPEVLNELAMRKSGLILITGATGMGKTTTFNAIIDFINRNRRAKIITIEDPVEFLHTPKKSIVVQQDVYTDAISFSKALVHILRQDPDVIGIGEMRDIETIATALTAAETGHLIIGTLHTIDASSSIERIVDVFPPHQQNQVRFQLSTVLLAVISQKLIPKFDKSGRVLACEILIANSAVRNLIKEKKTNQIDNVIFTSTSKNMQSMDNAIKDLYTKGLISYDDAIINAKNPDIIKKI